jgi:cell division septation protein DedD
MRDLERWKDKVELSLDGRQIFFLFFGSAVAACLIFVAGVLIGKRLEARALALTPPPVEDPLAALDQLGEADEADESLTYHKALTREPVKPIEISKPVEAPKPADVQVPEPKVATDIQPAAGGKVADSAPPMDLPRLPKKDTAPLPAGKPQVVAAAPAAKKPDGQRFTLQLSAFPERADAEEFMRKIQSAGYKPFLVVSEIPGKGVFYRVRVGDYATREAAASAKTDFEHKQRMIAYVAKL